ncbi:F-box/kelch-repeat protein At3g23880-like [Solanum pennellii]|uniref:F-box/kelch-repeat protein At3g23880-like n=1 Tax=Solanum pennellii TaxID=28526 RepID=A0ABM1G135_SOLPN|nr:F-box/kelch-repeat protein At3g23880-like [Solanum pennellii]
MAAKGKGNGKRKGKGKGNSKKTKSKPPDPTSNCIFPREIISNILSRLPVKTLLRFRCVCKPWRNLISKPNFIDTHLHRSSSLKPTFSPILIHTLHVKYTDHVLSLVDSPESSVTELDNPFPFFYYNMVVVGSCSGIVCLCKPPWGDLITLWNPVMRKFRTVQLSKKKPLLGVHAGVSIGLAYDSQENDFIILSLFCFRAESRVPVEVEMCSMKSFCWKEVKNEVGFRVIRPCCNVIIKGVPYWTALLEDKYGLRDVLVYFDVDKKEFDKLPMPGITVGTQWQLVNLQDTVGMLIWAKTDKYNIDVWVMDDEDGWSKKCTVGLVFGFDRLIGCLRNGDILAEDENGVLLLFDMVTSSVKAKLRIDNAKRGSSVIFNYSESLVLIREMLPVEKETARDKQHRENLLKAGINLKIISTDDPQQANWVNRIV